jgi:hypothetical protein
MHFSSICGSFPALYNLYQACPTRRPWYTFLAPWFTLPALTLIRISRTKYFWITVCFNMFRSTPMNTVFPLLQSFLLYPFYCPLTPPFSFLHWLRKYIFLIKRLVRVKFPCCYYYYYCNRHTAPAPPQPSVRCAPIYKNVGQRCYIVSNTWMID